MGVNGADILAQDAEKDKQDGTQKEVANKRRRNADRKAPPEYQLVNEIGEATLKESKVPTKTAKASRRPRHLREVGHTQHPDVVMCQLFFVMASLRAGWSKQSSLLGSPI